MRKFITLSIIVFNAFTLKAQQQEKALIRVKYNFSHQRDTTQKQNLYKETMLLIAGKSASAFMSYDKVIRDQEAKLALEQQIKEQGGNVTMIKMPPRTRNYIETEHFYYSNENRRFNIENFGRKYMTEETPEQINWQIAKDTVLLEGIKCIKATANFKGRLWIAWFAEEIPLVFGPWKLHGLPGLILRAYDDKNEVIFDFAGLEQIKANVKMESSPESPLPKFGNSEYLTSDLIIVPNNVVKTTIADLNRLKEARDKDPEGFAKAQIAAAGLGGIKPISTGQRSSSKTLNTFNNPIEKQK